MLGNWTCQMMTCASDSEFHGGANNPGRQTTCPKPAYWRPGPGGPPCGCAFSSRLSVTNLHLKMVSLFAHSAMDPHHLPLEAHPLVSHLFILCSQWNAFLFDHPQCRLAYHSVRWPVCWLGYVDQTLC